MNLSELEADNTQCYCPHTWKAHAFMLLGFGFTPDWLKKYCEFSQAIKCMGMEHQILAIIIASLDVLLRGRRLHLFVVVNSLHLRWGRLDSWKLRRLPLPCLCSYVRSYIPL